MKLPSLVHHIINSESRKVGFGYQVFLWATYGAFKAKGVSGAPLLDASTWLLAVTAATALIGGGTIADNAHKLELAKLAAAGGGADAPSTPAPAA